MALAVVLLQVTVSGAQNVGIGISNPGTKLTVFTGNTYGVEHTNQTVSIKTFLTNTYGQIGTTTSHPFDIMANDGFAMLRVMPNGVVGLGIANPVQAGLVVQTKVGAVHAMFGPGTAGVAIESDYPGVGLNTYFNAGRKFVGAGFGGLIGLNPQNGDFYLQNSASGGTANAAAAISTRLLINKDGLIGIQGNMNPKAPLSFGNVLGNKIALWGDAAGAHYGIGIQSTQLQLYSDAANADIVFGHGKSGAAPDYTETMRIKGTGQLGVGVNDPAFRIDALGRMRLRQDGSSTAGIWFNKPDNTQGSFLGTFDASNIGIFGPGAVGTWKFLFDGNDGTLRIGTTKKATGYLLNVGGKIIAEEVRVQVNSAWPDYVFASGYQRPSLDELAAFIATHHHLPNVPPATVMVKDGLSLGDMQRRMMEKIEELTLYILDLKKELDLLKATR
jgi:hypothetical protein